MNDNLIVCFDVDVTLFDEKDQIRYDIVNLLRAFVSLGCSVYVWSGSGVDYARSKVRHLGLTDLVEVIAKGSIEPSIAIDDKPVKLGKVNIQV